MAQIRLRGLRAMGVHGVLPEEQLRAQPFVIDVIVDYDASVAARSDDIGDALDYASLAEQVANVVERERFRLLERLAGRICDVLLVDEQIQNVTVTIGKPRAPISVDVDQVELTLTRANDAS